MLLKAQQGDVHAFGDLYDCYAPGVFRFLYAHIEHRQDAEDLTEEVFFRAWRALPRYHEHGVPFRSYLLRIARNALIDHHRRTRSMGAPVLRSVDEMENELADLDGKMPGSQDEHLEVVQYLEKLPEDHRTVLVLRFLNELTPDETARVMGRTSGAIRVLQHRALIALREQIQEEMDRGIDDEEYPRK